MAQFLKRGPANIPVPLQIVPLPAEDLHPN